MKALRWIALLPASVIASCLAWLFVFYLNKFLLTISGVDSPPFIGMLCVESIYHGAMGAAFVFTGCILAPTHRKQVSFVLSGLAILAVGFALFRAILHADYWATWACLWTSIGAGGVVYSMSDKEVSHRFDRPDGIGNPAS